MQQYTSDLAEKIRPEQLLVQLDSLQHEKK